jgi:ABC-type transporter Mla maintaining outer membrane lipid asymmetry ATPase subunit MlaF
MVEYNVRNDLAVVNHLVEDGTPGLGDDLWKMPGELSTGKRKLVALPRAMASEPSVLLFDEPCSGLDHTNAKKPAR